MYPSYVGSILRLKRVKYPVRVLKHDFMNDFIVCLDATGTEHHVNASMIEETLVDGGIMEALGYNIRKWED